jgi:ABC-type bacteriocin/lantibiotic exporter with double-glycine peptidase domain
VNSLVEHGEVGKLAWLCAGFLAAVLLSAALKFVLGIQSRINLRVRERVQASRDASDRISTSNLARVEDEVVADFRAIYQTRRRFILLKLSSKFALGAISTVGKVGILFLDGWLVLEGRSDVGTVVASLTGLIRIEGPWRDLVSFFRTASTVRVKYAMLLPAITARQ